MGCIPHMKKAYFHERMWEAVRRLGHSADVLGEILIEILEDTRELLHVSGLTCKKGRMGAAQKVHRSWRALSERARSLRVLETVRATPDPSARAAYCQN
jgi:hypothetical protein